MQPKMRGSERSRSSLKSDLLALKKLIKDRSESLDSLIFACVEQQLNNGGMSAEQLFKAAGRQVPSERCDVLFPKWCDAGSLGYLYQLRQLARRRELQGRVQQPNKQTCVDDLIAFTQLYTPNWVVKFLVESALEGTDRQSSTLIDPACGSGHFLLQAAEMLPIENIFGYDIDETGLFIARLSLALQSGKMANNLNLMPVAPEQLGSLAREAISCKFDAVVGNPPYIGRKLMDRELKEKLKQEYPTSHSDLCAAFLARGLELLKPGGKLAFITQSSLLVLPTYEDMRRSILREHTLCTVVELGPHVFPLVSGEKVNSVLLVIQQGKRDGARCNYLDLRDAEDKEQALQDGAWRQVDQRIFERYRACAFNFSCPPAYNVVRECSSTLGEEDVDVRQGLATTDNARFVRYWWQVPADEIGTRWFPYAKGSGSERWFAPIDTVVDWGADGAAIKQAVTESYPYLKGKTKWVVKNENYYFREGLTFSFVSSKNFAVRWLPPGCIFDVGGSSVFAPEHWFLLAYLNSSFVAECARNLNPTINFQVGDVKELPFLEAIDKAALARLARECVSLKQAYCGLTWETAWREAPSEFFEIAPHQLRERIDNIVGQLREREEEVDRLVLAAAREINKSIDAPVNRQELRVPNDEGLAYLYTTAFLAQQKPFDPEIQNWIETVAGAPLNKYIGGAFAARHLRAFRGTPKLKIR